MVDYVVGFLFDDEINKVVLIQKKKPEWQKDHWNGVGGKIEHGETTIDAMVREFEEETGVHIEEEKWHHVANILFNYGASRLSIFTAYDTENLHNTRTQEEEVIAVWDVDNLPVKKIKNLEWIIPLCAQWDDYVDINLVLCEKSE